MASFVLQRFTVFLLHLLVTTGSCFKEKLQVEAIQEKQKLEIPPGRMLLSPSLGDPDFDTTPGNIPVINPTSPGTSSPGITPTTPIPTFKPTTPPPAPPAGPTLPNAPNPTVSNPTSPLGGGGGGGFGGGGGGGQWCIASPSASATALQVGLDYACGYGGADCSAIQPGGSCYEPNTVHDHASFAFNDYFQKHPGPSSCSFGGAAQLSSTDPSNGNCHYSSGSKSTSISPPSPPMQPSPPAFTTPPTTTTPTTTTPTTMPTTTTPTTMPTTTPTTAMPGGPSVYSAGEPTGLPNSANPSSHKLLLLVTAIGLLPYLLAANYP